MATSIVKVIDASVKTEMFSLSAIANHFAKVVKNTSKAGINEYCEKTGIRADVLVSVPLITKNCKDYINAAGKICKRVAVKIESEAHNDEIIRNFGADYVERQNSVTLRRSDGTSVTVDRAIVLVPIESGKFTLSVYKTLAKNASKYAPEASAKEDKKTK